jgi:hypothetical protein
MTSILKVDELQDTSGNLIIKEDSNTITIGASGDTINVPSGATFNVQGTAGTGFTDPGLTHISSQTVSSGVSSVDFLSSFSSTYDNYILYYSDLGVATDNVDLYMRCASSTGTISGSDYVWGISESRSNNGPTGDYSTGATQFHLTYTNLGNAATESSGGEIIFFGTQDTTHHKMVKSIINGMSNGSDADGARMSGSCKTTSALVGFTIYASSGNIDSGKFTLFGVKK